LLDPPEQVIVDDGISLSKPENIKKE